VRVAKQDEDLRFAIFTRRRNNEKPAGFSDLTGFSILENLHPRRSQLSLR